MAVLTAKQRHNHTGGAKKFALSGERFPIGDKIHARKAEQLVGRSLAAGNITPEEASKVKHEAAQVLGQTDSTYHHSR